MYIWPDGSVTGSVNQQVLDDYNAAKDAGEDLSRFAPYLAENSAEVAAGATGAPEFTPQPVPSAEEQQKTAADALGSFQQERGLGNQSATTQAQAAQAEGESTYPGGPDYRVQETPQEAPQGETAPEGTQVPEEAQQAPQAPAEDDYDTLTKEQLQDRLGQRGLPTSGNKPELVDRLRGVGG